MVSVTSNRSRVRGEDPLCGIGLIWGFSGPDPSLAGVRHTTFRGIQPPLVPVGWAYFHHFTNPSGVSSISGFGMVR